LFSPADRRLRGAPTRLGRSGFALVAIGLLAFSFNIELRHLAGVEWFRPLTPYGGIAYVWGWLALALSIFTEKMNAGVPK
jgi:uncharacterized membrane protein YgdD (TMEM256/DUF423 family)